MKNTGILILTLALGGCDNATRVPMVTAKDQIDGRPARIVVSGTMGDVSGFRFLVDTGAARSSVSPRLFEHPPAVLRTESVYAGGTEVRMAIVRVPSIAIGDKVLTNPEVWLADPFGPSDSTIHGVLGMDFLSQYRIKIDTKRAEVIIE